VNTSPLQLASARAKTLTVSGPTKGPMTCCAEVALDDMLQVNSWYQSPLSTGEGVGGQTSIVPDCAPDEFEPVTSALAPALAWTLADTVTLTPAGTMKVH